MDGGVLGIRKRPSGLCDSGTNSLGLNSGHCVILWGKTLYSHSASAGLQITAGQRTMSGQDDYLSGQNFGLAVILTGHVQK